MVLGIVEDLAEVMGEAQSVKKVNQVLSMSHSNSIIHILSMILNLPFPKDNTIYNGLCYFLYWNAVSLHHYVLRSSCSSRFQHNFYILCGPKLLWSTLIFLAHSSLMF